MLCGCRAIQTTDALISLAERIFPLSSLVISASNDYVTKKSGLFRSTVSSDQYVSGLDAVSILFADWVQKRGFMIVVAVSKIEMDSLIYGTCFGDLPSSIIFQPLSNIHGGDLETGLDSVDSQRSKDLWSLICIML